MKKFFMAACCAVMPMPQAAAFFQPAPHGTGEFHAQLSLDDALHHALESHPDLDVAKTSLKIAEARQIRANLRPSPTVSLESENLAGRGELKGLDGHETTLALSQTLELGGKRKQRTQVARLDVSLADWDRKSVRQRVLETTYLAFIDALAAQSLREQEAEKYKLAKSIDEKVQARVEAGKVSPLEGQRSQINLASARVHWQQAEQRFLTVRKVLAGHLGKRVPFFETLVGTLDQLQLPPEPEKLANHLLDHPELARQVDETLRGEAMLRSVKAARIPDLTLKAGYRRDGISEDASWVVGFSVPIPNIKRNLAAKSEALSQIDRVAQQKAAIEHHLWLEFAEVYESLIGQFEQAQTLASEIIPAAKLLLEGTTEGYREGKFSYLEVLDSQRAYFETLKSHTDALSMYHRYKVKLQALLGRDLTKVALGVWIDG